MTNLFLLMLGDYYIHTRSLTNHEIAKDEIISSNIYDRLNMDPGLKSIFMNFGMPVIRLGFASVDENGNVMLKDLYNNDISLPVQTISGDIVGTEDELREIVAQKGDQAVVHAQMSAGDFYDMTLSLEKERTAIRSVIASIATYKPETKKTVEDIISIFLGAPFALNSNEKIISINDGIVHTDANSYILPSGHIGTRPVGYSLDRFEPVCSLCKVENANLIGYMKMVSDIIKLSSSIYRERLKNFLEKNECLVNIPADIALMHDLSGLHDIFKLIKIIDPKIYSSIEEDIDASTSCNNRNILRNQKIANAYIRSSLIAQSLITYDSCTALYESALFLRSSTEAFSNTNEYIGSVHRKSNSFASKEDHSNIIHEAYSVNALENVSQGAGIQELIIVATFDKNNISIDERTYIEVIQQEEMSRQVVHKEAVNTLNKESFSISFYSEERFSLHDSFYINSKIRENIATGDSSGIRGFNDENQEAYFTDSIERKSVVQDSISAHENIDKFVKNRDAASIKTDQYSKTNVKTFDGVVIKSENLDKITKTAESILGDIATMQTNTIIDKENDDA